MLFGLVWLSILPCGALTQTDATVTDSAVPPQKLAVFTGNATRILAAMKKTCDRLHLEFVGPTTFTPLTAIPINDDNMWDAMLVGPTIRLESSDNLFTFSQANGVVVGYTCTLFIDKLPDSKAVSEETSNSTWTQDHAISIATAFKDIFVEKSDAKLGVPNANYSVNTELYGSGDQQKKKCLPGMWTISWPRVDSNGSPFKGEHITISMQEGFAPFDVGAYLTTN